MRRVAMMGAWLLLLGVSGCDSCAKKKEADKGPAAPPPGSVTCFDLPGASRSSIVASDDGGKVLFLEQASKDADTNLVSVDLATGKATTVAANVRSEPPIVLGGKVLYVALGADDDAGGNGSGRLVARDLASGAETVLAGSELAPRSVVVNAKTSTVFFVGREEGAKDGVAFQVGLAGGTPKKLGPAILIWAVAADGRSLIVRGRDKTAANGAGTETDRLALDGTVTKLGPNGYSVTPVGDHFVYAAADETSPLQTMSAAGVVAPLPGSQPKDALFLGSPMVARTGADGTTLFGLQATGLDARISLVGVGVESAVNLPNGAMVILATQDTSGDGRFGRGDEQDVCVVGPQGAPITVPKRDTPKRYANILPALRQAAAQDLPGAVLKLAEDGVHIELPGEGELNWEALREKVRSFYKHAIEVAKDPRLVVAVSYGASQRAGTCYAKEGAVKETCRVGVAGVAWLDDRTVHDVALDARSSRDVGAMPPKYRCAGTLTNLSDKPLRASVVCDLVARGVEDRVLGSKHFDVESLAPKAAAKYDLELGSTDAPLADVVAHVRVDGKEVVPFFPSGEAKATAWLATTEAIRNNTGFAVRPRESATSLDTHADFDVPKGFGALPDEAKKELVKKLRAELVAFDKRIDPAARGDTGMLSLYEEGKLAYFLEGDGKLDPVTKP